MIAGLSGSTLAGCTRWVAQLEGLRPRKHGRTQRGGGAVFTRDHHNQLEVGQTGQGSFEIRHVVLASEVIRRDQRPRPALAEDVSHLFGSVDVDDRNEDHSEWKQSVETGDGLSPIRKLEGYDIPRDDPLVNQGTGEAATHVGHAPDGADERTDPGADPARDCRRIPDPVRGNVGQRIVAPPTRVPILSSQVGRGVPRLPAGAHAPACAEGWDFIEP